MKMDLHDTARVPFYRRVSYLFIPALFVVSSVLLEVMMFAIMGMAFPKAYVFSLSIVLIIAALVALIRKKWIQTIFCSLLFAWQLTTSISNIIAYDVCMEIFSLETLKTLIMAFGNAGAVNIDYLFLVPIVALIVVYVVGVILIMMFCRAPKTKRPNTWQAIFCGVLAFVSFFSYTLAYSGLSDYKKGHNYYVANLSNEKFLYDTFSNRVSSLRTFGSYSYYLDNFLKICGVKAKMTDTLKVKLNEEFKANTFALPEDQTLSEGDNLIMVLMETFERAAINPVTMPNLYAFMKQSCVEVDGYYSIERTCFTDHIAQTGMHESGKELWNNYGNVTIPHSLGNIFQRSGYQTKAFHNYDGRSYQREKIFTSRLGFDSFTDFNDYDNPHYTAHCGLNSDKELFVENMNEIAPADKNFYSYLISVSTHALNASRFNLGDYYPEIFEYLFSEKNADGSKNENWEALKQIYPVLANGNATEVLTAKNYLAGTYNFDLGFGALLEHLRTTTDETDPLGRKLIETTAIVMFGDHYYYVNPFALESENKNPRDLMGNRSPLIVYNPKQKINATLTQGQNAHKPANERVNGGYTIQRFTSTMDIYPTTCSLFGIQTDQQLTYGHSIFSTEQSIGVGYLGGYTWGALDETDGSTIKQYAYRGITYYDKKVNWQLWRTLDFVEFNGVALTPEQIEQVAPLVNRTYASVFLDTSLYDSNGFKDLAKSKAYHLRKVED
ncbi:MAG: sulfatase-like hydrolase/transferase [Eubacteriales bacterium]|nr:sulfatase-like hydrolase/transferase [Eubacteriales bacterium]